MENVKQEHTTHLTGAVVVSKTSVRIEFRGRLDSLNAAVVELQIKAERLGNKDLVAELEEVRTKIYELISCEVTGKPCEELSLWGLDSDEIRERSHHPAKYFNLGHIRPHYTMGETAAALNALRTKVRETELSACRAFETATGQTREDIVKGLNRLSSAIYILTYKYLPEGYDKTVVFSKSK